MDIIRIKSTSDNTSRMAFKFLVLVALVAISRATVLVPSAGVAYTGAPVGAVNYAVNPVGRAVVNTEYNSIPQYTYAYSVQDPITGDSKSQVESRSGDIVQGRYALNDPDGTRRTVDYTADSINGFNAVVQKTPIGGTVAAPVVTIAAKAQPVVSKVAYSGLPAYSTSVVSTPVAYSAGVVGYPYTSYAPYTYNLPYGRYY